MTKFKKRVVYGSGGFLLLLVLLVVVAYWLAEAAFNRYRGQPQVLAAPPASLQRPVLAPPYSGPHPRLLERPQETFPFPIAIGASGPVQPLFAGPLTYPFLCRSVDSDLGQPLVDNQQGYGMAVLAEDANGEIGTDIVGYSKDCSLPTRIDYYYLPQGEDQFKPWRPDSSDAALLTRDGQTFPFIVQVETGTINRHIYFIAMPVVDTTQPRADLSLWNGRLIYQFRGGVGIGYRQGRVAAPNLLKRRREQLALGYAVAYSSANQTSNTYDIWMNEDTALRVKRQFVSAYAKPDYTVGVGGSGGAIQQYLLGQNRPGLIDAAIALYGYPDMVTQSIYVLDCELLEYYFDRIAPDAAYWLDPIKRAWVEGASSSRQLLPELAWIYRLSALAQGRWPRLHGATECSRAWRGATPLVINPTYAHFMPRYDAELSTRVEWTYFADLAQFYGTDAHGFARRTWDNVGVQYGLAALKDGRINVEQFLHLNHHVGSWKPAQQMQAPRFWLMDAARSSLAEFSPWDDHNMQHAGSSEAAPRAQGDSGAISGAYRSGQVFLGRIDIPVIDLRHYLDPELDMHHAVSSLSARVRMQRAMGHAEHQLIWMTRIPHEPYAQAFALIDQWMGRIGRNPHLSVVANKPAAAQDRCYDADGRLLASGPGVWDGEWNNQPVGACSRVYPAYTTSRMVAGDGFAGDVFKCSLQSIDRAIAQGVYGAADMRGYETQLQRIFPEGVCDYAAPDQGFPPELAELAGFDPSHFER